MKNLLEIFQNDKFDIEKCKNLAKFMNKIYTDIPSNYSYNKKNNYKDILYDNINKKFKLSNNEYDYNSLLFEIIILIILFSNGDIQKTNNWLKVFLKENSFLKNKDYIKSFIEIFLYFLNKKEDILTNYFKENLQNILKELQGLKKNIPLNYLIIIERVCISNDNKGKLSGKIKYNKNIIYQKRKGPEFSINFTNQCPNACTFCIRDFSSGWKDDNLYLEKDPSVDEIKLAIKNEINSRIDKIKLIKFCGYGEPLVRPNVIIEVSKYIKSILPDCLIQINTSGWPYYDYANGYLKKFHNAGVSIISVSINAPDENSYNRITRPGVYSLRKNAYQLTLDFIKESVKHGFKTRATLVKINNLNQKDITRTENLIESYGATFLLRKFIGDFNAIRTDNKKEEIETKILNINRNDIINKLKKLGFKHCFGGISIIINYDIPLDKKKRAEIVKLINLNSPELRKYFELLKIISKKIKEDTTFIKTKGFLRIKYENNKTYIVYKEPKSFVKNLKFENEFLYEVDNIKTAKKIMDLIGLEKIRYIEKNRESFVLDNITCNVDTWPQLQTYLKIEAEDEIDIFNTVDNLDIRHTDMLGIHAEDIFQENNLHLANLVFSKKELEKLKLTSPSNSQNPL